MEVSKKWQTALIWLVGIIIMVLIVCVGMKDYLERWLMNEKISDIVTDTDAGEYYYEHSTVLNTFSVYYSTTIQTEKEAIAFVEERGFNQYAITYDYTYDGDFTGDMEATGTNDKHPIYQTYYISSIDEVWSLIMVNGTIIAKPLIINSESETEILIAESNVIIAYDDDANLFYETIPNESETTIKVVDKINAETLDSLTKEEIDKL